MEKVCPYMAVGTSARSFERRTTNRSCTRSYVPILPAKSHGVVLHPMKMDVTGLSRRRRHMIYMSAFHHEHLTFNLHFDCRSFCHRIDEKTSQRDGKRWTWSLPQRTHNVRSGFPIVGKSPSGSHRPAGHWPPKSHPAVKHSHLPVYSNDAPFLTLFPEGVMTNVIFATTLAWTSGKIHRFLRRVKLALP
jgi:hypothetical protein